MNEERLLARIRSEISIININIDHVSRRGRLTDAIIRLRPLLDEYLALEAAPPALGISISETTNMDDRVK